MLRHIAAAIEVLRQETDRIAQTHATVASDLKGALTNDVSQFQQGQANFRSASVAAIEKVAKAKSAQAAMVERARDKYQGECVKVNTYTAQMSLVQGRDLERTAAKLEKAKQDAVTNERNYRLHTKALKDTSHNWAREWKAFLDQAQDVDEARIEFIKQICWRYVDSVAEACVADDNACQNVYDALKSVNASLDSSSFVSEHGTGNMVFDAPEFVNYAEGHAPATRPQYRIAKFRRVSKRPPPELPVSSTPDQAPTPQVEPEFAPAPPNKKMSYSDSPHQGEAYPSAEVATAQSPPQPWQNRADSSFHAPSPSQGSINAPGNRFSPTPQMTARQSNQGQPPVIQPSFSPVPAPAATPAPVPTPAPAQAPAPAPPANHATASGTAPVPSISSNAGPTNAAAASVRSPARSSVKSPPPMHTPVEDRLAAALRGLQMVQGTEGAQQSAAAASDYQTPPLQISSAQSGYAPAPNQVAPSPYLSGQTQSVHTAPPQSQPSQPTIQPSAQPYSSPSQPPQQQATTDSQPSLAEQYMHDYQRQSGMQGNTNAPSWERGAYPSPPAPAAPLSAAAAPAARTATSSPSVSVPVPAATSIQQTQNPYRQASEHAAPQTLASTQPLQPQAASAASEAPLTGKLTDEGLPVQFFVKALYDYTATTDSEFSFTEGDIIAVTDYPPDGWWKGELLDEARRRPGANTFPSNFVQLLV